MSAEEQAHLILERLQCERSRCVCHTAARRGWGLTHAVWRGDHAPSLSVAVHDDRVLVCDFARRDQEDTIGHLRALDLWHGPSGRPRIRIARLPKGVKDVADLLEQGRDAEYEQMIRDATPAVAWMVEHPPQPGSPEFGLLGRTIERLDSVQREAFMRMIAEREGCSLQEVREELRDYLHNRKQAPALAPPVWERDAD